MNSKKQLDPLLMDLKESVLGKINESFSQGGMVFFGTKGDCMYLMLII